MSAPWNPGETGALAAALLLGVAFGWLLERGGMGSARKLAGQFQLTDLSVLRLMFSAVLTAMLGSYWLARLGALDLARVSVPPTWWLPQAAGGIVFGAGFAVAGLCPGTSCVAAATGRVDGMAVAAGMLAGSVLFASVFPQVEEMYESTPAGAATLPDVLGLPYGAMVLAVAVLALAAFGAAGWVEARAARRGGAR